MERPDSVAVIDDLGSGSMIDMTPYGAEEPNVIDSVRSGADVSLFSGDKLSVVHRLDLVGKNDGSKNFGVAPSCVPCELTN